MANRDEIKAIELRRLAELEKRRAAEGAHTDPAVLIEIADLRAKYGTDATAVSRAASDDSGSRSLADLWSDVDFLRALLTSALRRMTALEEAYLSDALSRKVGQLLVRGLLILNTALLIYELVLKR